MDEKFWFKSGTHRHARDLFPKITKSECTPTSGQEDDLWHLVAGDAESTFDEFGVCSDDEDVGSFAGVDND